MDIYKEHTIFVTSLPSYVLPGGRQASLSTYSWLRAPSGMAINLPCPHIIYSIFLNLSQCISIHYAAV